jgi:Tfp pilus assembly protein PilF
MKMLIVGAAVASIQASQADKDRDQALRHLRAGQEALEGERFDVAEVEFNAAVKLDPSLDRAYYGLGRVHMATRRYVTAVQDYRRCRDVFHENNAKLLANGLEAERSLDDQIRSLEDLRNGLQTGRVRSQNQAASVIRVNTEIRQLENLRGRKQAGATPTPPYISTALGSAYFRTGAFAEAEQEWRNALGVDPSIGEVHNNLAIVLMETGRLDDAEREIALAEKAGFRVSDGLKRDLTARKAKSHLPHLQSTSI